MLNSPLRIVSLIPSATEIVAALGLGGSLVGRSHECDHPPEIRNLPACTEPRFDPNGRSREIHDRVSQLLDSALSVYRVKTELLIELAPTHILTQAQCEVCAANLEEVERAVATVLDPAPHILSLQPQTMDDLWSDIARVADLFSIDPHDLLQQLHSRIHTCVQQMHSLPPDEHPSVVCLEWTDPLMVAGLWIPQLVEWAGGRDLMGLSGTASRWLDWDTLFKADPEVLLVLPCGFDRQQTWTAIRDLSQHPGWYDLSAVAHHRVYGIDGNQYFNRPGPRLVDSLEILAEVLHSERVRYGYEHQGWERWTDSVAAAP